MSWFYESRRIETPKNGPMKLTRLFGRWELRTADWTQQSSPYVDAMWRKTLRAVVKRMPYVRRCLVLGLGLGGIIRSVRSRFGDAEIVGVDWDGELARLGRALRIFEPDEHVRILEGDVAAVVPDLSGPFDLIVVDIFVGRHPAPAMYDPAFQDALIAKLGPEGVVCVNGYNKPAVFEGWAARLASDGVVRYQMNRIAIFRRERDDRQKTGDKR